MNKCVLQMAKLSLSYLQPAGDVEILLLKMLSPYVESFLTQRVLEYEIYIMSRSNILHFTWC